MPTFPTNEFFDQSPSGILIYHDQGLCYANPAALALLAAGDIPLFPGAPLPESWQESLCAATAVVTVHGSPFQLFPRRLQNDLLLEVHPLSGPNLGTVSALRRLSQQLRGPLSRLMGAAECVDLDFSAQLARQSQTLRDLCQLLRTVNSIQLYSDLSKGTSIPMEVVDLSALCRSLCRELSSLLGATQVDLADSLCIGALVQGNASLLRQLILQLVSNALAAGTTQLTLTLSATRTKVTLTLRDNGSGLPAHRLSTAFSPVSASEDPGNNGFNLGLPLCQQIAQLHKGTLLLSPPSQGGTTVSLTLPRASDTTATVRAPEADFSGGLSDLLLVLSNVLPAEFYDPEGL